MSNPIDYNTLSSEQLKDMIINDGNEQSVKLAALDELTLHVANAAYDRGYDAGVAHEQLFNEMGGNG